MTPKYSQPEIIEMVKNGQIGLFDAAAFQFIPAGELDSWVEVQRQDFQERWKRTLGMIRTSRFQHL